MSFAELSALLINKFTEEKYIAMIAAVVSCLLQEKFKNPLLRSMLLATEDVLLVESNTWGDRTWGVYKGAGENWLGRLLMEVRAECREEEGL